jgi:hypothetical protein
MKKIIYIVVVSIIASLAITSCTEENVKPATSIGGNGGGSGSSDPIKD